MRNQGLEHHLVTQIDGLRRQGKIIGRRGGKAFTKDVFLNQLENLFAGFGKFTTGPRQCRSQFRRKVHDFFQVRILLDQGAVHALQQNGNPPLHFWRQGLGTQHPRPACPHDAHRLQHRWHLAYHRIHEIVGIKHGIEGQLGFVSHIHHEGQQPRNHRGVTFQIGWSRPAKTLLRNFSPIGADTAPDLAFPQTRGQDAVGGTQGGGDLLGNVFTSWLHCLVTIQDA